MKVLIFVPARGGSKGILDKNIVELKGKPLIYYTLDIVNELMENKQYDWIPFISTDNEKISSFCNNYGFEIEYKRPKKHSSDKSLIINAIFDALDWLNQKKNIVPDAILLLQPTSPIRRTKDIMNAIKQVENNRTFSIVSVTKMREHPYECIETKGNKWSYLSKPDKQVSGRQDYKNNFFFIDGSFYLASVDFLIDNKSYLVENKTKFFLLDQRWPIDIDESDDLLVAESFLK